MNFCKIVGCSWLAYFSGDQREICSFTQPFNMVTKIKSRVGNRMRGSGEEQRETIRRAYAQGVSPSELLEGDVLALQFEDGAFDMVREFGVLHHVRTPALAIEEMLRVARKAVFISDSNNFGQGSFLRRSIKQVLDRFGLWPLEDLIKTKGRGYTISDGDGLAYSYSVFNNYTQIQ